MANILEASDVQAWYGQTQALFGVTFEVEEGGVTTLLGANGAGKTTTLRAICGMIRRQGAISLSGDDVSTMATEMIVRRGVGHVPDGRGTFTRLTVEENLRLGAYSRVDRSTIDAEYQKVFEYFPRLKERRSQQAGTLSGGEQQMLAIGRALMASPRLLLLDEPSFGLAPLIVQEIFAIMRRINAEQGMSILLVEQNASLALELADHAYLIEVGKVVMGGPAEQLKNDEGVRRAYLGY